VHLEPQTVAERVSERLAEASRRDDVPRQRITFSGRHPWAQVLDCPALGSLNQLMNRPLPLVGACAYYYSTGEVGTVSVHLRAEVKQQQIAHSYWSLASPRVRQS
jgi:hypothetical protein